MRAISFQTDILPLKNELFRMALRITMNREEAEDVVQETMIKVWNRRDEWEQIDSIEAFCFTICRNLSVDKVRRKDFQAQSLDASIDPKDLRTGSNPEEQTVQRDRLRLVREIINQLPEKQRTCLQLRDMEGKSYKEIAAILEITEQQVKTTIFRARQTIRDRFRRFDNFTI